MEPLFQRLFASVPEVISLLGLVKASSQNILKEEPDNLLIVALFGVTSP